VFIGKNDPADKLGNLAGFEVEYVRLYVRWMLELGDKPSWRSDWPDTSQERRTLLRRFARTMVSR
jgi:hypothetical protein